MSKTDTDLLDINRESAGGTFNTPNFSDDVDGGRTINVFDYETADGMPFMLAKKYDGEAAEVVTNSRDIDGERRMVAVPTADALASLHNWKTRDGALNFWYNLNFDANIFLKDLSSSALSRLRATNHVEVEVAGKTLEITYLPKKMLEIRSNGNVSRHYDISQFTYTGTLEDSVESWLDGVDGKATPSVDPSTDAWDESLKAKDDDSVPAYIGGAIEQHSDEVFDYARRDVVLTEKIAKKVIETAEEDVSPPIPFGQPYSTGYVAGDYLRAHGDAKPRFSPVSFQRAALKSYAGGRFEVYERGRIEEAVAGPDINSAYPAVMDSLPSLYQLSIGHASRFDGDYEDLIRRTYGDDYHDLKGYGFVKIRVSTDAERRIQPFARKDDGVVKYPAMNGVEVWTLAPIVAHAIDAGYVEEIEFLDGFFALPTDGEADRLFAEKGVDIGGLYAKRKSLEAAGKDRRAKLIKIVLNSLYGKTCQINPKRNFLSDVVDTDDMEAPEDGDVDDYLEALTVTSDDLPNEAQRTGQVVDGEHLVEEYQAGSLFNPAIAAYTTGMTRLKLHESVVSAGLEDDTLMLATDCMLVRADAFDRTALADEADSEPDRTDSDAMRDALGGWDYDYRGENGALIIASGVYEIYGVEGEDNGVYTKARGFRKLLSDDYPTLRGCIEQPDEYLNDARDGIEVSNSRPRTFGEVVFQGKSLRQVGEFFDSERTLSADMDRKRGWKESPTMVELLADSEYGSAPTLEDDAIDDSA